MADWLSSMQQTFEFYIVNPITWKDEKPLEYVTSCTINRDSSAETLGSATFDMTETISESYVRVYLVTIQNGVKEKHPLGVFLAQSPSSSFDGKVKTISMDAYTPLLELKEKQPPLGYSILKSTDESIMDIACRLVENYARAPIIATVNEKKLTNNFIANSDDTWLTFLTDLIANAKYTFDLDEMGRIMFKPEQKTASLQPVWTYNDDNSSILYSDVSIERDIYGIPNVIEVIYSNGSKSYHKRVVNDDPNSPTSTVSRGREIVSRITDPGFTGIPSEAEVEEFTKQTLKESSSVEYSVIYEHGYCPVRLGDCVMLNYSRAGLKHIKAKVVSQSIKCEPGCRVTEKAVFTAELWG